MRIFTLLLFVALLFMPVLTWSKGPAGVVYGVHNLSASGVDPWSQTVGSSIYATNTDQVCVFCHTPHGGSLDAPLWNRANPNPSRWSHYNSATLSVDLGLSLGRTPNQETLLCLSCHDGSVSVNHVTNPPSRDFLDGGDVIATAFGNDPDNVIYGDLLYGGPGKRIGASWAASNGTGDLSDDHPISFSYTEVYESDPYTLGAKGGTLKHWTTAKTAGIRFFGDETTENFVECSSCHDPHVNYTQALGGNPAYTPFLNMPNSNSDLCLACHTK